MLAGIRTAWAIVCQRSPVIELNEDQMTIRLLQELVTVLDDDLTPGFTTDIYSVTRDSKIINFDGMHPDKMPDLTVGLRANSPGRLPAEYGIHIECKPVGREHGLAPYYGDDGMQRFVRGDYACTMKVGMMLAYAEPGYGFESKMRPCLERERAPLKMSELSAPGVTPPRSSHFREWRYANHEEPGPIELIHLWLDRA